jgi:hypothetical protein
VQADSPTHFSSTIDLKPIEGSFDLAGRKFKYSSKLSIKVEITLHPSPKGTPEYARESASQKVPKVILPENSAKTSRGGLKTLGILTVITVVVVLIVTEGGAMIMRIGESMKPMGMQRCPALRSPLWLTIDPKDSGPIA